MEWLTDMKSDTQNCFAEKTPHGIAPPSLKINPPSNTYITPHDIKNYDQLSEIVWDKAWDILTETEKKIAIDAAKYILDHSIVWESKIRYCAAIKLENIKQRRQAIAAIRPCLFEEVGHPHDE